MDQPYKNLGDGLFKHVKMWVGEHAWMSNDGQMTSWTNQWNLDPMVFEGIFLGNKNNHNKDLGQLYSNKLEGN